MCVDDETLMAWVDGELNAIRGPEIEAAVAADPALARRAGRMRMVRELVADGFAPVLAAPAPSGLRGLTKTVATLTPRRRRRADAGWTALAASVALLVAAVAAMQILKQDSIGRFRDGVYVADARLSRALDRTPSGAAVTQDGLRLAPRYSFRDVNGRLCRVFTAGRGSGAVAGAACHEADLWRLIAIAPAGDAGDDGVFRQADGGEPEAVAAAVEAIWADAPLDAGEEAAAIRNHWRTTE
jgi:hypothetical protein